MEGLWALLTVAGPIILGLVIAYGIYRNRQRRKRIGSPPPEVQRSPEGAARHHEERAGTAPRR
jgi:hypothetical protein